VDKLKDFFKCGISIGSRLCTNPHIKKSEVIMIKGKRYLFFVIWLMFGYPKDVNSHLIYFMILSYH